jgi:iron complex outermembrane receptor protein
MKSARVTATSHLGVLLVLTSLAMAQAVPPQPSPAASSAVNHQAPIELSPFVVSDSSDTGWVATETLAGSRLRTDYKDVANQIETLTKDLMTDLGLTNIAQAMIYSANVENMNESVGWEGGGIQRANLAGRVRGLGPATTSRNFFAMGNPTDNFNIERASIASGPNAILFGLGNPTGIIDATPARAQMRNKYGFELHYDSAYSKRATFDANVVVVPGKLAVRIMGLDTKQYSYKRPTLDYDKRGYAAVTFKPFPSTTLILQGENADRQVNGLNRIVPADFVTPWLNANQIDGSGYSAPKPAYNNNAGFTGIANNRIFAQAGQSPVLTADGAMRGWRNSVVVKNPSTLPGVNPTYDAGLTTSLLDPAVFPFDVNIQGLGRLQLYRTNTKTVILEQKLAANLNLEIAYNRENARPRVNANETRQMGGNNINLMVDPNQFLPNTTTPNPNFGKFYYQGFIRNDTSFSKTDDYRVTLSYELDLARKFATRGGWAKWLGRHRMYGLYSRQEMDGRSSNQITRRILDDPVIPGITLTPKTTRNWALNATRLPQFRHYFNTPYDVAPMVGPLTGDWTLTDANGRPYKLYLDDTGLVSADGKRLAANSPAAGSLSRTDGQILAWQGYFLPDRERHDRLVLSFGYRKDWVKNANLDATSIAQDFSGLYPVIWDTAYGDFEPTQSGINRSFGVVARPLKWVSFFYNQSSTFNLSIGNWDPFGNPISAASGKGKDYGIRLDLWNDKVALRLNKYRSNNGPQQTSTQIKQMRPRFQTIEQRVIDLNPGVARINVTDGNKHGYLAQAADNYLTMMDAVSTGYELGLDLTPVRNWNIRVNGSKSQAKESNIATAWFEWVALRLPVWQGLVATNGELDASRRPVTWKTAPVSVNQPTGQTLEQYYNSVLVGQTFSFIKAVEGRTTENATPARVNLITNYQFVAGPLKGFNLGGAARWRDAQNIGYALSTDSAGNTNLDVNRPYRGRQEMYVDGILGYRGRMKAFGNFSYRLQLNVRNVLNEDDPLPVKKFTTGQTVVLGTIEPRVSTLTFAVEF